MYIKIQNDNIIYPYNINLLYQEYPNTSFPNNIELDYASLKDFNIYNVIQSIPPSYDALTQKCVEIHPELVDSTWQQRWEVQALSAEEQQVLHESRAAEIRAERNRLLLETDWTQLQDISIAIKDQYATYRQQLRDVTAQTGFPHSVTWPQKP